MLTEFGIHLRLESCAIEITIVPFLRIPRSQSIDNKHCFCLFSQAHVNFFSQAKEASLSALQASVSAEGMSKGIKDKSGAALAKTQELNDKVCPLTQFFSIFFL